MNEDKFNSKYNPEFSFYSQFNITEDEIVDEISDTKYDINGRDELFYEAAKLVVKKGSGSASDLQLNFKIGYHRSGKIINQLEEANILQHSIGGKIKKALIKNSNDLDILIQNEK